MTNAIERIDTAIAQLESARNQSRNAAQRAACDEHILNLMRERMELTHAQSERALDRGAREHAAWYDTSAELN